MEEIAKTIQCSNINCLVFNPHDNKFCHQCGTPIVRRYLSVLGEEINSYHQGDIIGDRYIVQKNNILLDSQPGSSPDLTEDLPPYLVPYLKLFSQRLHIPQVYGFTTIGEQQQIWLLEYCTTTTLQPLPKRPKLIAMWSQATAMRQLNWLWQIASLWQPFSDEGVAETLIEPSLIRVQNSIIKLKELKFNARQKTPLKFLGHFWSTLVPSANYSIKNLLKTISQAIINHKIIDSKELLNILDQAIAESSKTKEYHYQICTYTDVGKTRQNNEDSCYPPSASSLKIEPNNNAFAIVCDGIGGHEGGEIASGLTIEFLQKELPKISRSEEKLTPETLKDRLQQLTCAINDLISNRNNTEQRFQQRQRMGTTIVMSFACNHEIYFTHVGDSRIYWITQNDCQQITVDDDLASRQVRLGYSLYRDALLYPGAGALIQALGMNPSISLFPTTQRYLIDEDSVFLLCSDGLSDFDRVEQHWEKEILPILTEKKNLSEVGQRLIKIANETSGHDNITIALVHCQVMPKANQGDLVLDFEDLISSLENLPIQEEKISFYIEETEEETETELKIKPVKTKKFSTPRKKKTKFPLNLILIIFILLGSIYLIYALILEPLLRKKLQPEIVFEKGQILKTKNDILLYPYPFSEDNPNDLDGVDEVFQGSILQIVDTNEDTSLLKLKLCYTYSDDNLASIAKGESGWIKTQTIINKIDQQFIADDLEENWCNKAINFKQGDVIKTTEDITFKDEQSPEIKADTILKVIEITEDKSLIKLEICYLNIPENSNQPLDKETEFIPIEDIANKFDQENINNYSLDNTSCNSNMNNEPEATINNNQ